MIIIRGYAATDNWKNSKDWLGDSVTPAGICVVSLFLRAVELGMHAFLVKIEITSVWQNMGMLFQVFLSVDHVKEGQVLNPEPLQYFHLVGLGTQKTQR